MYEIRKTALIFVASDVSGRRGVGSGFLVGPAGGSIIYPGSDCSVEVSGLGGVRSGWDQGAKRELGKLGKKMDVR